MRVREEIQQTLLMLGSTLNGKIAICKTTNDYKDYLKKMSNYVWEEYRIRIPRNLFKWQIVSTYSAWFNEPTIIINYETYLHENKGFAQSEVLRNIVHMVIHRSPSMYIIPTPDDWIDLERRMLFNQSTIDRAFYILADSVREFEVTRYLVNKALAHRTIPSLLYKLRLIEKESTIWKDTLESQALLFTIMLDTFRLLAQVSPLLAVWEKSDPELEGVVNSIMDKIPIYIRKDFEWLINDFLPRLGNNTIRNINMTASIILSTIIPSFLRMKNSLI